MDIKKISDLSKLNFDGNLKKDLEGIIKWAEVLEKVPDVEPLFTPYEGFTPLREDNAFEWDYDDPIKSAPEKVEGFIRFISPIGRKT